MKRLRVCNKLLMLTRRTYLAVLLMTLLFSLPFFISIISNAFIGLCEKETVSLYGEFDNLLYGNITEDLVSDSKNINPLNYIDSYGVILVGSQDEKAIVGSIDETAIELGHVHLIRGTFPKNENDICICESLLYESFYDCDIGSEIIVGKKKYDVTGIINDYYVAWNKKSQDEETIFPNALIAKIDESELMSQVCLIKNKAPFPGELYEKCSCLVSNTNIVSGDTSSKYNIPDFVFSLVYVSIAIVVIYIFSYVKQRDLAIRETLKQLGVSSTYLYIFSEIKFSILSMFSIVLGWIAAQVFAIGFITIYNYNNSGMLEYLTSNVFCNHFYTCILICILAYIIVLVRVNLKRNQSSVKIWQSIVYGRKMLLSEMIRDGKSILISSIVVAIMLVTILILSLYMKMYIASKGDVFGKMPIDYDYQFSTNQELDDYSYVDNSGSFVSVKSIPDEDAVYYMPNHSNIMKQTMIKEIESEKGIANVKNYVDANDVYLKIDNERLNTEYLQGFQVEEQITDDIAYAFNLSLDDGVYRNAQFCGFPQEDLSNLAQYVREGDIDNSKISSGEEIILIVPVYERVFYDDGSWSVEFLEYDKYKGTNEQFCDHSFSVGDKVELTQILPISNGMMGYLNIDQLKNKAKLVTHQVTIGAIIYERVMWFEDSSQFPTAYTLIGTEETFNNLGIEPTFSRTQIYLENNTDFKEFEPIIHKYQSKLKSFVYTNNAAELKDYRRFMILLQEICFALIVASACLMLVISISETYISYVSRRKHYAMLRVIGMPPNKYLRIILCRTLLIWGTSTALFVLGGVYFVNRIWGNLREIEVFLGKGFLIGEVISSLIIVAGINFTVYWPLMRKYVIKHCSS